MRSSTTPRFAMPAVPSRRWGRPGSAASISSMREHDDEFVDLPGGDYNTQLYMWKTIPFSHDDGVGYSSWDYTLELVRDGVLQTRCRRVERRASGPIRKPQLDRLRPEDAQRSRLCRASRIRGRLPQLLRRRQRIRNGGRNDLPSGGDGRVA